MRCSAQKVQTVRVTCVACCNKPVFHAHAGNNRPVSVLDVKRALNKTASLPVDAARKLLRLTGIDYDNAIKYANIVSSLNKVYSNNDVDKSDWMRVDIKPNIPF